MRSFRFRSRPTPKHPAAREKKPSGTQGCSCCCTLDFLKSFYFCPGWLCHFKGLFTPVGREIHRTKIATVTSWQLTNRRLRVSAWRNLRTSRNISVFAFFPRKSTTCFKSIPVKQVDRRDFVARFVATSLKLASRNNESSTCNKFFCIYGWCMSASYQVHDWLAAKGKSQFSPLTL